jgi:NADPH-dependent curcumin reductase CurA
MKFGKPKKDESLSSSAASDTIGEWLVKPAKLSVCTLLVLLDLKKKVMHFKEIGFDVAFNYKANDPAEALPKLCPNDFVIYFDNVCCKVLEGVSKNANPFPEVFAVA